jgi:hypothetical protein
VNAGFAVTATIKVGTEMVNNMDMHDHLAVLKRIAELEQRVIALEKAKDRKQLPEVVLSEPFAENLKRANRERT